MNNDQLYFYNRGFNDCLAKCLDEPPAKTLTADDIHEAAKEFLKSYHTPELLIAVEDWYGFARAILKKASEK